MELSALSQALGHGDANKLRNKGVLRLPLAGDGGKSPILSSMTQSPQTSAAIKRVCVSLAAVIVLLGGAGIVHANGFGMVLDKQVGDYTVNIDYDAIAGIFANDPVQFAFQLFNRDRTQAVDFNDVWVTITPTGTGANYTPPIFSSGIATPHFAPAGMTFAFPKSGSYDIAVRFEKDEKVLAEASFPLTAAEYSKGFTLTKDVLIGAVSGLALASFLWVMFTLFFKRKRV